MIMVHENEIPGNKTALRLKVGNLPRYSGAF